MKKTILTLLVAIGSLISSAQDTIEVKNPIMYGVELGAPIEGRGLINPNVTIPQRISSEYHIVHYLAVGYSFLEDKKDEYLFSYGIGIPLRVSKKSTLYAFFIDAHHYRPDVVVVDPTKNRDFRQRRIRIAFRTNKFEVSTTYTLRHSAILGISYSFKNK
jgi:hypothetical protein|tara:strand:+ start:51 stop:530 length:480 start_codon:yes stop_codon:yes gene_type:complete